LDGIGNLTATSEFSDSKNFAQVASLDQQRQNGHHNVNNQQA
jgi:hypothetical protein